MNGGTPGDTRTQLNVCSNAVDKYNADLNNEIILFRKSEKFFGKKTILVPEIKTQSNFDFCFKNITDNISKERKVKFITSESEGGILTTITLYNCVPIKILHHKEVNENSFFIFKWSNINRFYDVMPWCLIIEKQKNKNNHYLLSPTQINYFIHIGADNNPHDTKDSEELTKSYPRIIKIPKSSNQIQVMTNLNELIKINNKSLYEQIRVIIKS